MRHPTLALELVPLVTQGDRILDMPLADIGGKGLFLKELEHAMLRGEADIAVHSVKDVPSRLDAPFALTAILPRADPADAFVSERYADIAQLPNNAKVGTSSLRRQAQLKALRPDLQALDLRGNVNTRIEKLARGEYDAIILACAGLQRLGMQDCITKRLAPPAWLPAVGQGAIGIECIAENTHAVELVQAIHDETAACCIRAERRMNALLEGGCDVPIAAFAEIRQASIHLSGLVGDRLTGRLIRAEATSDATMPEVLGETVAKSLLAQGAAALLDPATRK